MNKKLLIRKLPSQDNSFKDTFCNPRYYFATFIDCMLRMLQQLSGINAVILYTSEIFKKVGRSSRLGSALTGVFYLVSISGNLSLLSNFYFDGWKKNSSLVRKFSQGCIHIRLGITYIYVNDSEAAKACCVPFIFLFIILFEFTLGPIQLLFSKLKL